MNIDNRNYFKQPTSEEYIVTEIEKLDNELKLERKTIDCSFIAMVVSFFGSIVIPFLKTDIPISLSRVIFMLAMFVCHGFVSEEEILRDKKHYLMWLLRSEKYNSISVDRDSVINNIKKLEEKDNICQTVLGFEMSLPIICSILIDSDNPKISKLLFSAAFLVLLSFSYLYFEKYKELIAIQKEESKQKIDLKLDEINRTRKRGNNNEK